MRAKHGHNFVSGQTRKLVYAMLAEKAAAPVPPTTQQPAAAQPVPAAAVTPETRAQQAAAHLARVKHAQNEFSGCALPVPIIPTTLGVSRTVLEHERIKRNQHIAAHVKPAWRKGFRALSDDFRPLLAEFPPLQAPSQPSPAMAMRHKAPPQAGCRGASSAQECVQSPAAPKAAPDRCAISAHVTSQFALAGLTATNDAGKPGIQQMEPTFTTFARESEILGKSHRGLHTSADYCENRM